MTLQIQTFFPSKEIVMSKWYSKWLVHSLTRSWRRPLSSRNQSIDLLCKSMDWFLYGNGLCHERVNHHHLDVWQIFECLWQNFKEIGDFFVEIVLKIFKNELIDKIYRHISKCLYTNRVLIQSFSDPYFAVLGVNRDIYSVNLHI